MKTITSEELRRMDGQEGLILQGCGGPAQEWLDGINEMLTEEGILKDGTRFTEVLSFQHEGLTNLLFPFDGTVQLDMSALAMWRLKSHGQFGGTWLSDYVPNRLGGFLSEQSAQRKPEMELAGHDGNIFAVLGRAAGLLRRAGMEDEVKEMSTRVMSCGSYGEALRIISEYVRTELSVEPEPPAKPQKSDRRNPTR